ncbi:RecB family nuclease [Candidatus Desulfofervidus auxilii]|uniref:RecB family nuclease n=1 Tax=Desulfofervidus auxilii TaxID=1621989 RepID=A0A7U4TI43_DESA2|nr:TM0106 family RecB-like putative nuclease [Candidatus Desulfofervidus auxilii]AMM40833.1 RecB family nuclease [Candidatus Desulfofervidus auxilii]CAD7774805.1 RNase_H superfamily protein [Candidatus Methanoperedenaceae archaeon GB50]CAD7776287.1 RNase_H superfamily protein [Candidatus Methanoperedenaceae archaeon GB37]
MALTLSDIDKIYERCLLPTTEDRITARTIYNYCISPFMVHCEKFGPEDKKDPLTQYQEMLFDQGKMHETQVIEIKYPEAEKLEYETLEEGFRMLLEGMRKGVRVLCGLPAFYLPEGLVGTFDVVERRDTKPSIFGSHHYVVKEIKLAKNIQKHHIYQVAFYNYILGKIQGYTPPVFYVINRDYEESEVGYDEAELLGILEDIREIWKGNKEVSPTYGACEWPWENYNNEEAIRRRDISLVSGIGPSFKQKLINAGISTINDLAKTQIENLVKIKGIGRKTAEKFSFNSKALVSGECICLGMCEFPEKRTEIFLDLEGTGEQVGDEELIAIDYLIGVLTRKDEKAEYTPFIAYELNKEGEMFRQFVEWLLKQDDFIIYHWHHYERTHLKRLAERYGLTDKIRKVIFGNMRDLYRDAISCFAFPTYGNGLKEVASYMGYKWRHPDVNALESIALYFQYVEDPDKNKDKMQKVIDYNEDDCRATMLVKDWLKRNSSKDTERKLKR